MWQIDDKIFIYNVSRKSIQVERGVNKRNNVELHFKKIMKCPVGLNKLCSKFSLQYYSLILMHTAYNALESTYNARNSAQNA